MLPHPVYKIYSLAFILLEINLELYICVWNLRSIYYTPFKVLLLVIKTKVSYKKCKPSKYKTHNKIAKAENVCVVATAAFVQRAVGPEVILRPR